MQTNGVVQKNNSFSNTYIEKCKNYQECLEKLQELFITSGVDIEYDDKKEEAFFISESRKIPMKRLDGPHREAYCLEIGDKLIGFYFDFSGAMLGFGVDMELMVKDGKNFQSYAFKQSYFDNSNPWFYYDEYIDGKSKGFSSNGHIIYFNESNVPSRSALSTINRWGDDLKVSMFKRINGHKLSFGGMHRHKGYENGKEVFNYIPTVSSEVIKNGKSEERSMMVDSIGPVQTYEVKKKYNYTGKADNGMYYPYYEHKSRELTPFAKFKVFEVTDPEILDYCIDVLNRNENKLFYYDIMEYLMKQPVNQYLSKYFRHLTDGIEYYHSLNREDIHVSDIELGHVLKLTDNQ